MKDYLKRWNELAGTNNKTPINEISDQNIYGNEFVNDIPLREAPNVGDAAEGQKDGIYTDSSKRLIIEIKDEVVIKSRSYK